MRTNIVLDDVLVTKALKISGIKTKRALVMAALHEFIQNHSQKDIRELKGKVAFSYGYDYKKLREGKK